MNQRLFFSWPRCQVLRSVILISIPVSRSEFASSLQSVVNLMHVVFAVILTAKFLGKKGCDTEPYRHK